MIFKLKILKGHFSQDILMQRILIEIIAKVKKLRILTFKMYIKKEISSITQNKKLNSI